MATLLSVALPVTNAVAAPAGAAPSAPSSVPTASAVSATSATHNAKTPARITAKSVKPTPKVTPNRIVAGAKSRTAGTTDDWSTSLHDVARTAASSDTALSTANAPTLAPLWTVKTGGPVATTTSVVGGVAYFGSWDGYEYAVNTATGTVLWKTYLGFMKASTNCGQPNQAGISSPATVLGGEVYVGGADSYWYALNTTTGAVDWRVWVGGNGVPGVYDGHMNWSGPLVVGNYAYVGVASFGDCPLVQGQLLKVNLTTHLIENTANLVPNGQVGAGIWTSPAYDAATGLIYTATGTENLQSQLWSQAFLAIDATTMEVKDSWKLPENEAVVDSDFGTSTTLFTDSAGRGLVVAINKNGDAYAFLRSNLAAGPVWRTNIAVGGTCPQCGQTSVSSGAFGGGALYLAGGYGNVNGIVYPGSVRALDPTTGAYIWQHTTVGPVIGALAYDNGLVFDGAGSVFEALDASSGKRLYSYDTGTTVYAGPSTSGGIVFVGNIAGQVVAFAPTTPVTPPADPNCPAGFTCQDIGSPAPAGSETVTGTGTSAQWTVKSGGPGVRGTSDAFRLISQPLTGDGQIAAKFTSLPSGGSSATGLMIRANNAANSPYYAILTGPNKNLKVQIRRTVGGTPSIVYNQTGPALPLYLAVQRHGDYYQAAISTDGVTYNLLPGTDTTLALPTAALAGISANSGAANTQATAKFTNFSIGAPSLAFNPAASADPCPTGWSCADVGNPALVGDQTLSGTAWTVKGAGGDIWGTADQFHYVWQQVPSDATVSAQVTSQTNTATNAKAGVMMRGDATTGSAYYAAYVTPGVGIVVQYRDTSGNPATQIANPSGTVPAYLQVARSGTSFTAYTSADGVTWTAVQSSTVSLPNLGGTIDAGLAVTSHTTTAVGTAAFGGVAIGNSAPTPPNLCPTTWSCEDIGSALPAGSQTLSAGTWNVLGGGGDMWGSADQLRMVSQAQSADGTTIAQVSAQTNSDPWAKSGVITRLSDSPNAPYYAVLATPANGVIVQYRAQQNGSTVQLGGVAGAAPVWLKIGRVGLVFTAYTSGDGVNWTAFPNSARTLSSLSGTLQTGMAVCSHNTGMVNATSFTSVAITGTGPVTGLPYPWAEGDVGGATPAGSTVYANSAFTVQGGGNDIWGTNDQFHYVYQSASGDLSLVARVTAQSPTDPLAKSGIMVKQSATAGAAYAMVAVTPGNGVNFTYGFNTITGGAAYTLPNAWVRLDRTGNVFTGYSSADGLNWLKLGQAAITMTPTVTVGLAVSSHSASLNTSAFDHITITPIGGGPLPTPWTNTDIGGPAIPGSANFSAANGNVFTLNGSGRDIWGAVDEEQYASQPLTGDGAVTARITAQDLTDPWARSGVMFKESTTAGAAYAMLVATPGNGLRFEYGYNTDVSVGTFTFPNTWLKLVRSGSTFTAYTSPDGATWTSVASATITMNSSATVGLVDCSHNASVLNASTFDHVAVTGLMPAGWTDADVGSPAPAGSASYQNGTFTLNGGGNDVWGTTDQFNYDYQTLSGNGTITARVTAQQNTSAWAKTGVMVKQSTTSGSPYAALFVSPGNGIHLQANFNSDQSGGAATVPSWLRLQRVGTAVTGFVSADGSTWTQVGSPVTVSLTDPITIGLYVCSHNGGTLNTSAFDNVTITSP